MTAFARWWCWVDGEDREESGDLIEAVNASHAAEKFAADCWITDGERVCVRVCNNAGREWKFDVLCSEVKELVYRSTVLNE